uniref:(northern house mosquito) hypothetical protein n=1 Tax=Culex pipiens TaxID=7175 RepID=A0A8D8I074_CULPI
MIQFLNFSRIQIPHCPSHRFLRIFSGFVFARNISVSFFFVCVNLCFTIYVFFELYKSISNRLIHYLEKFNSCRVFFFALSKLSSSSFSIASSLTLVDWERVNSAHYKFPL